MTIYFSDGNGGRKIIAQNDICLVDLKLTGFSKVAGTTGEITDDANRTGTRLNFHSRPKFDE